MAYTTTAKIQNLSGRIFSDSPATPITATQMAAMVTAWSNKLDGLVGGVAAAFGTDTTAPQWVQSAVETAVSMLVDNVYLDGVEHTETQILNAMKQFIVIRDRDVNTRPSFSFNQPDAQGKV